MAVRRESGDDSEASSTLSEFVSRRYRGQVNVFGGDPRVGASELSAAMIGSLRQIGLVDAVNGLRASLESLSTGIRPLPSRPKTEYDKPVNLIDNDSTPVAGVSSAAELDMQKVHMLLEASMLDSADIPKYRELVKLAQSSLKKQQVARRLSAERKSAMMRKDHHVLTWEFSPHVQLDVVEFVGLLGFTQGLEVPGADGATFLENVNRSFVHESLFGGRTTNRKLAILGDSVLKTMLMQWCVSASISVGDASGYSTTTHTNIALRDLGIKHKLEARVRAVAGMDTTSRNVLATVVEALFGAAYMSFGMEGVFKLNETIVVNDFRVMNKLIVDEAEAVKGLGVKSG